jgi:hypothetical protein
MVDTRRNLHQLLKGKQLYNALYGVYTEELSSKRALPKGKQPRPQLLHLHPSRNSVSEKDESGNVQTTLTKEPRILQHPPWESLIPICS